MNPQESKRILARFVAGDYVDPAVLAEAQAVLGPDHDRLQALEAELGFAGDWPDACEIFAECVAEFSECSPAEREMEMPEFVAHLKECAACQRLYSDLNAAWISATVPDSASAKVETKELGNIIRLVIDRVARGLRQIAGPAPLMRAPVALAAHADVRKEALLAWQFGDPTAHCTIEISTDMDERGDAAVAVRIVPDRECTANLRDAALDIVKEGSTLPSFAGRVRDVESRPVILGLGKWRISIAVEDGQRRYKWVLPLHLDELTTGGA